MRRHVLPVAVLLALTLGAAEHLARAREHFARAAWVRKERERWVRAQRRPRGLFIGRL